MTMPGRTHNSAGSSYKYGFNGHEKSVELNGDGNSYTAEYWQYDSRLGRRWNVDPILKEYESPYSTFGGNPIINIDPDGADTVNITRTTTRIVGGSMGGGLDGIAPIKIPDVVSSTGDINIKQAEGQDVFIFTQINVTTENGITTTTSSSTTLDIRGTQNMAYRNAGQNAKGFHNDRFALASMAPDWLLDYYAEKNKSYDFPTWVGMSEAKALQKTVPFANRLNQVANVAYTITGVYGLARGFLFRNAAGIGFNSFREFKNAYGAAGPGKAWHHIVEQNPANIAKFGSQRIHNTTNLIKLDHGAGTIHAKVSGYYSSIQPFTNGQTVRKWVSSQSYQQQYDFGIKTLKQFGWTP